MYFPVSLNVIKSKLGKAETTPRSGLVLLEVCLTGCGYCRAEALERCAPSRFQGMAVLNPKPVLAMIRAFRRNWRALGSPERTTVCGVDSMLLALQLAMAENNRLVSTQLHFFILSPVVVAACFNVLTNVTFNICLPIIHSFSKCVCISGSGYCHCI